MAQKFYFSDGDRVLSEGNVGTVMSAYPDGYVVKWDKGDTTVDRLEHASLVRDAVRQLQVETRALMSDRTGDGNWRRVPPEKVPLYGDTAAECADWLEGESCEPQHFVDLDDG